MPSIKEKASRSAKPQPDPLRKLSFGAITRKQDNAKTAYPVLPDPNGQLAIIVARIIDLKYELEPLEHWPRPQELDGVDDFKNPLLAPCIAEAPDPERFAADCRTLSAIVAMRNRDHFHRDIADSGILDRETLAVGKGAYMPRRESLFEQSECQVRLQAARPA